MSRLSNAPTIVSNVAVGIALGRGGFSSFESFALISIFLGFYAGGMILNDCCDLEYDRCFRPERPLPLERVSRSLAWSSALLLLGSALLGLILLFPSASFCGLLLLGLIVLYDYHHKGNPFAPTIMGVCRALVYIGVVAASNLNLTGIHLLCAMLLASYVMSLTRLAQLWDGRHIGVLVAGISLLDCVLLVFLGRVELAFVSSLCFFTTVLLQRWIPGH